MSTDFLKAGALAALLLAQAPASASAQEPSQPSDPQTASAAASVLPEAEARRRQTARELEEIRQAIALGEQRRQEISVEIDRLEKDRASINENLIAASARARDLGARIDRSGERLEELRGQQEELRGSLRQRSGLLAEVLGGLLRMGRNPPPAILVRPDDALSAVHSAMALGAVVPEMRAEMQVLATELGELVRIGTDIDAQRTALSADLRSLAEDEERLNLLLAQKKESTAAARRELAGQSAKAAELAARESSLSGLIARLETEVAAAREAAEAAQRAMEERRAREAEVVETAREELAKPDFSDMARLAPAMEFEQAKGLLPKPVDGVEIHGYGQTGTLGEPAAGLSLATRVAARVTSPADGWVVYAGPFRSYGQLLILNAGSGYHVVMAGMERIDVQLGQFVLAGEPVAVMGSRRIASLETIGVESARPVLYVEFRKDGKSIDPSPWWAVTTSKRVADDT